MWAIRYETEINYLNTQYYVLNTYYLKRSSLKILVVLSTDKICYGD